MITSGANSEQPAESDTTSQPDRSRRLFPAIIGSLITLQLALLSLLTHESWFFVDDFLFLGQARTNPFSLGFLRLGLFEHFSPIHRVIDYAFIRAFGLNWATAHIILLGFVASCAIAFAALANALFSSRRVTIAVVALYGNSLFFVRNVAWWTGGIHLFALTLASLLTLLGFVRWHQTASTRWIAFSFLAYTVALLSHEQAMTLPLVLLLLRLLLLAPKVTAVGLLVQEWRIWSIYGALTAAAAWNFLAHYYLALPRPSSGLVVRFLGVSFFQGFLPSLMGIKIPESVLISRPFTVVVVLTIAGAVVVFSRLRSRGLWRPWVFLLLAFVISVLPLAMGRITLSGIAVGLDLRYQTAPAYLGLLAIGAAFDPRYAPPSRRWSGPPSLVVALLSVIIASYLGLYLWSGARLQQALTEPTAPRRYFSTLQADLRDLRTAGRPLVITPGTAPDSVVPKWLAPYNTYEYLFPILGISANFAHGNDAYTIDEQGRIGSSSSPTVRR